MVRPSFHAAYDRWIGSEVLLHGAPAAVLDRGPPLDDEGDRGLTQMSYTCPSLCIEPQ
jgi:hypothetical protein